MCQPSVWKCLHGYMAKTHLPVLLNVVNSRCHTQLGQEMDQTRQCDIGRRNIGPTMRSVDRVLENSSEVGEKADYPVYQPCKKRMGMRIVTCFRPFPLLLIHQVTTTTFYPQENPSSFLPFVASHTVTPLSLVPKYH